MIVVCAWCSRLIGEKPPLAQRVITHGICEECRQKMEEKWLEYQATQKEAGG